ncbi:ribose ABC transporter permease [Oculatella sp. LEGE 06141]|uniref:ABC transporter permease subunit n=1 Tax=Oculatella sp. LEGE 06141 TaxID=1828648 RepID=UPI001880BF8D|nr:ribose ABC transporter permease [Oculatella sp. LEGE 06141]MBE9180281.1 ribose ABC transporter permease [Oculatella sp. LEGE 06141]
MSQTRLDKPEQSRLAKRRKLGKRQSWQAMMQVAGILPILLIICILFAVLTPNFLTAGNLINVVRQASINIVLAAGMTFVILTGGIDLSVGSILGVSAVVALLVSLAPGLGAFAVPAALLAGLGLGLVNGALIAYLDLPPFIVTLGSYTGLRGIAYLLAGGTTLINPDINFAWVGNARIGPVPWLVIIALAIIVAGWFILRRTVLGTHIYAVGGNLRAARLTGIKVSFVLLFVYGISGLLSGLAGIMSASRLYSATGMLGQGYELDAIAAVILGGTSFSGGIGTIWGTLLGALIIALLNNGLTLLNVSFFWQLVVKGLVIIVAVTIDRLRTRSSRR